MSTDVLISFDTTGSMSPCIAEVRRRVTSSLDYLLKNIPDLRIGIISHGDYCDGDKVITKIPFTSDVDALRRFVINAPNTGGGDSDECYEYVMHIAGTDYEWKADNKILILIGDAEPHESGYSYGGKRYFLDWRKEAHDLATMGISIYSIQALGHRSSEYFYKEIASYGNGRKLNLNQFTDAVETITAACFHKVGKLQEYKDELISNFRMNRNLASMFDSLGIAVEGTVFTKADSSGLIPVSPTRFQYVHVDADSDISSFVRGMGITFHKGRGFYELTKTELVQEHKEVILRNKTTGDMFTGDEARSFIGLPYGSRGTVRPVYLDKYDVFVQSTSSNRKLIHGTKFLYENIA